MHGYDVARAIRADGPSSYLVALSGHANDEDRERSAAAGFDFHMAKPPSEEELEKVIADAR
jgi:CheY-like chemotaxis protein